MQLVQFTMVIPNEYVEPQVREGTGEDDDLDNVVSLRQGPQEKTQRMAVNPAHVRNFYPRKGERVGTRILFVGGSAIAVTETFEQVRDALSGTL